MLVSDFNFKLPEECIALRPSVPRETAKLLVVCNDSKDFIDKHVLDLPCFFRKGDVLVVNDTKVICARLKGTRKRGDTQASIEVLLHQRIDLSCWKAFVRPSKKLKLKESIIFISGADELSAIVTEKMSSGEVVLQFNVSGAVLDTSIAQHGELPLPPYIMSKRKADAQDSSDYQTIFAQQEGAVAAPTAGLHLTSELVDQIQNLGVTIETVTLHVGAGTFLPVKSEDTDDHVMHGEWGNLCQDTTRKLNLARKNGGRIIAVGTTTLRLLESATDSNGIINPFSGETCIFMIPGYKFKSADVLLTNFHLPKSTLFMLVCAFCGVDTMKAAYTHAISNNYRFYSYGDASLLFRNTKDI